MLATRAYVKNFLRHFHSDGLASPSEDWSCLLGEGVGLRCWASCMRARTHAHTQPYGSSHVLSFKGTLCQMKHLLHVQWIKRSGALTVNGCLSGGDARRSLSATVSCLVYLFALWHSDAERAQLLHWIICYVIWCHDKGFEMWSSKLVKCALCKFK